MGGQSTARFYSLSLNAATYDLGVGRGGSGTAGIDEDVAFYLDLARGAGGRVLELASGTGRVSLELAEAGCDVTGLDSSRGMLDVARRKLDSMPSSTRDRVRFTEGDMVDFELGRVFDLVIIPFRSFAFLLDLEDQRRCLARVLAHLRPGGLFAYQVFDPRLDKCVPGVDGTRTASGLDPETGHTLTVDVLERTNDPVNQVLRETWRFTETDSSGTVLRTEDEELALRWTYRHEMRHLLELSGFDVLEEYSDFHRSPPAYGREQVWLARRPTPDRQDVTSSRPR